MTTRGRTLAALLAALGRPSWWILALAGFLVRGGIVIFSVAIVTLPSPLALSNVLGPIVTPLYLGRVEPGTLALIVGTIIGILAWLIVGTWFAALTEVALIRAAGRAAADEGLGREAIAGGNPADRVDAGGGHVAARAGAAHLVALIPMALAIGVGSIRIFDVAYRELVNPSDASPIVLRVVAGAIAPIAVIVVGWVLGEIVGGLAVRRIVLEDEPVLRAVASSALDLVRQPVGSLLVPLVTTGVLVLDLAAVLTVVALVWSQVRTVLVRPGAQPVATGLTLLSLGAAWCLALLVTGLIDAWRSASLTFEVERRIAPPATREAVDGDRGSFLGPSDGGTIGASAHRRPGDWSADDRGGSL